MTAEQRALEQIKAVIRRVDDIDMAASMIYAIVEKAVRGRGGRPRRSAEVSQTSISVSPSETYTDPDQNGSDTQAEVSHASNDLFIWSLAQFCHYWRNRYRVTYLPTPADKNQLGRLLRRLSPEEIRGPLLTAFVAYLQDDSPFVAQEMRHNLRHFCGAGGFNKYRAQSSTPSPYRKLG